MSRQQPALKNGKPKARQARTHWYNPALPTELPEPGPSVRPRKARERVRRRQEDRRLPKIEWTWAVIGLALAGVVGAIGLIMLATTSAASSPGAALVPIETDAAAQGTAAALPVGLPDVEIKPWDGRRRLTALLMGLDKRPGEVGRGFRTDTLILISLDPATQRISMLSIPRDLQVPIPGREGMQPINAAYVLGELERPGYGPRLAADTIQYNLGIPVDHYVVVSFEAVINLVDAIGGVTIEVKTEIIDNEYPDMYTYGYDPLYIPAGMIEMDGELALKYARTRHQTSDFDRTYRQQQLILAIRNKILRVDMLPQLIAQAPVIWDEISRGVITDLRFEELLSLGWYAKDIPVASIRQGTIDGRYIQATQYNGQPALTINRELITELMVDVFGPGYSQP